MITNESFTNLVSAARMGLVTEIKNLIFCTFCNFENLNFLSDKNELEAAQKFLEQGAQGAAFVSTRIS